MNKIVISMFVVLSVTGCMKKSAPESAPMPKAQEKSAQAMPKMSPEEMMAKMEEAGKPGENHAQLQPLVGKWRTTSKFWMDPSKDPEISKGTANHQWLFGKRFIKQEFKGKWGGKPFEGVGVLGYDNVKKQYVSNWIDSAGTGIMDASGSFDPNAKELILNSTYSCPMTQGERQNRSVTRIISNNEHVFEMFDQGPDGREFKMMEITYKR